MIIYVENPMKSTIKLWEVLSEFTTVEGYKTNIQRSIHFYTLAINNKKFFFVFFAISWAASTAYGGSQAGGRIRAVAASLRQSHSNAGIRAASATYTTAHGNAVSLTHWARPEIEPTTSWFLVDSFLLHHDGNSSFFKNLELRVPCKLWLHPGLKVREYWNK